MTINGFQIDVELLIACAVAGIWLVRQEGRITRNAERTKDIEDRALKLEGAVSSLHSNITDILHKLELAVARIETKLELKPEKEI